MTWFVLFPSANSTFMAATRFGFGAELLEVNVWEYDAPSQDISKAWLAVTTDGCVPVAEAIVGSPNGSQCYVGYFLSYSGVDHQVWGSPPAISGFVVNAPAILLSAPATLFPTPATRLPAPAILLPTPAILLPTSATLLPTPATLLPTPPARLLLSTSAVRLSTPAVRLTIK
ncbi:hypothetical protein BaRGS_00001204 [Batillaria attramentaria]|uniref:Uncharacterized protein n=1 Tax=Batillaria attramentaria TaxID=370345 RepID=A0ABD0M671_9CAEN